MIFLYESGEESGSEQIDRYLEELRPTIGDVGVILVLDAECEDYKTLWCCTSLRGVINGTLTVEHLATPCHSGMATGIVPDTFRIARMLISRIEDEQTGRMKLPELFLKEIPQKTIDMFGAIAKQLGHEAVAVVNPLPGSKLLSDSIQDMIIARAFEPGLAVTAADGLPPMNEGSNVIRTKTALKLSVRIPPGIVPEDAAKVIKETLEKDPPYGAKVSYNLVGAGAGWKGKDFKPEVEQAIQKASMDVFGQQPLYYGDGGSIPLCNLFQRLWEDANVIVTGAAGLDSNAHGFDESLNIVYTGKFTAAWAIFFNSLTK